MQQAARRSRRPAVDVSLFGVLLVVSFPALLCFEAQAQRWLKPRGVEGNPVKGHAMAYDVGRERTVVFGGYDPYRIRPVADTLEWDGKNWIRRSPSDMPIARSDLAMVYDVARRRVVLFGGLGPSGPMADTWEWDGDNWIQRLPFVSPLPRFGHAMVYDAARKRVVLFGGLNVNNRIVSDTWEWDGSNWTQRSPANKPKARNLHAMAYDVARQRVVLFGGQDRFFRASNETWEWDGNNWTQRSPTISPSPRYHHMMAYDAARKCVILFAGTDINGIPSDTWEWDGNNWKQRSPTNSPTPRYHHAMAYDAVRQRVVLSGGADRSNAFSDTWEWDGSNWTQRSTTGIPDPRYSHTMAGDFTRRRIVLFGGRDSSRFLADTWEWDGSRWQRRSPTANPNARAAHAMAYDGARQRVLLFGGMYRDALSGYVFSDTWEWDSNDWRPRYPTTSPGARFQHAMACDIARQRIVLFGGSNNGGLSDTWEWDGRNWQQRSPAKSPSARYRHAMAYDLTRQRVLLFGGWDPNIGNGTAVSDTWEWDGNNWTRRSPARSPSARFNHAMAYDVARQRVLLFGGVTNNSFGFSVSDTWEWNGSNWTQLSPGTRPDALAYHAMAYDTARRRVVLHGGFDSTRSNGLSADTWHYSRPAASRTFGNACSGSSNQPILTSSAPYLGHPRFRLELIGARPASACLFALSARKQDQPIPPCALYLRGAIVPVPAVTNWAGFAGSPSSALPLNPNLRGLTFFAQAFIADPKGPVPGLTFSAGLRLVVGD